MHHYIHKSNKCATLYPLLCDKNSRKGRRGGREGRGGEGRDGGETQEVLRQWLLLYAESHRDTSKFLWCTLDDHCGLSSVSYRLSNRVCACACECTRVCVRVSFYFLAIPLFVVCCFLLCLYNWKISYFSIVVTLDDIWFVEKKNVLWLLSNGLNILCFVLFFFLLMKKGLDSKWRARIQKA